MSPMAMAFAATNEITRSILALEGMLCTAGAIKWPQRIVQHADQVCQDRGWNSDLCGVKNRSNIIRGSIRCLSCTRHRSTRGATATFNLGLPRTPVAPDESGTGVGKGCHRASHRCDSGIPRRTGNDCWQPRGSVARKIEIIRFRTAQSGCLPKEELWPEVPSCNYLTMFTNAKSSIAADRMMSRFLGDRPGDVPALYACARERIFINPALNEPLGATPLAAASLDAAGPCSLRGADHFGKRAAEAAQ